MLKTCQIDGRTVTYLYEPGAAPVLVCIHGAADNQHVFDRLLDALPNRARFAINLPGRAGTDGPPLGSVAEMEAFLSGFVESEVQGNYLVVGHSLGGGVAIEHALVSPTSRLQGLVLLATGARLRVHPSMLWLFEELAKSGTLPPPPPGLYEQGTDPDILEEAAHKRELTPIETAGLDWRATNGFDRMQDLEDIRAPALIVAGSDDAFTPPKYAHYLAARIPLAELVIIEGAGHMLVVERVAELAQRIESFVAAGFCPVPYAKH